MWKATTDADGAQERDFAHLLASLAVDFGDSSHDVLHALLIHGLRVIFLVWAPLVGRERRGTSGNDESVYSGDGLGKSVAERDVAGVAKLDLDVGREQLCSTILVPNNRTDIKACARAANGPQW